VFLICLTVVKFSQLFRLELPVRFPLKLSIVGFLVTPSPALCRPLIHNMVIFSSLPNVPTELEWAIFAAFVLAAFYAYRYFISSRPHFPPGPRPDPIIGNLRHIPLERSERVFAEWSNTYGWCLSLIVSYSSIQYYTRRCGLRTASGEADDNP